MYEFPKHDFPLYFPIRNIFLGETFSSYISVHNDSNQVVKDILVKVTARTLRMSHGGYGSFFCLTAVPWLLISTGGPADELPEVKFIGVELGRIWTQTRVLYRWCHPSWGQGDWHTHVRWPLTVKTFRSLIESLEKSFRFKTISSY